MGQKLTPLIGKSHRAIRRKRFQSLQHGHTFGSHSWHRTEQKPAIAGRGQTKANLESIVKLGT